MSSLLIDFSAGTVLFSETFYVWLTIKIKFRPSDASQMTWYTFHSTGWEFSEMSTTLSLFVLIQPVGTCCAFSLIFSTKRNLFHPTPIELGKIVFRQKSFFFVFSFLLRKRCFIDKPEIYCSQCFAFSRPLLSIKLIEVHVGVQADSLMESEITSKSSFGFRRRCIALRDHSENKRQWCHPSCNWDDLSMSIDEGLGR